MMASNNHLSKTVSTCTNCKTQITKSLYNSCMRCSHCLPSSRACANQSCSYIDTDKKCEKHEWFFCEESTSCGICKKTLPRRSLFAHYDSSHQDITHATGSTWRATAGVHDFLVTSDAGIAVCQYGLDEEMFTMYLSIPVKCERLSEFYCVVKIDDPDTGYQRVVRPDIEYIYLNDWRINVRKNECTSWSTLFDVCVDINKFDKELV